MSRIRNVNLDNLCLRGSLPGLFVHLVVFADACVVRVYVHVSARLSAKSVALYTFRARITPGTTTRGMVIRLAYNVSILPEGNITGDISDYRCRPLQHFIRVARYRLLILKSAGLRISASAALSATVPIGFIIGNKISRTSLISGLEFKIKNSGEMSFRSAGRNGLAHL